MHLNYLQEYKNAADNSPLHGWTTSQLACFQGIVLIRNLAAEPHKDRSDYADELGYYVRFSWWKACYS